MLQALHCPFDVTAIENEVSIMEKMVRAPSATSSKIFAISWRMGNLSARTLWTDRFHGILAFVYLSSEILRLSVRISMVRKATRRSK